MNNKEILVIAEENLLTKYGFIFSLGLVLLAPLFLTQLITGPVVNMALFITAYIYGLKKESLTVAAIPSIIALLRGQLPLPLAPMIPFIITGNIILMYVFIICRKKTDNYLFSAAIAGLAKFSLLHIISQILVILFAGSLFVKFSVMMSWPQLLTAIIGGVMSYFVVMSFRLYQKVN